MMFQIATSPICWVFLNEDKPNKHIDPTFVRGIQWCFSRKTPYIKDVPSEIRKQPIPRKHITRPRRKQIWPSLCEGLSGDTYPKWSRPKNICHTYFNNTRLFLFLYVLLEDLFLLQVSEFTLTIEMYCNIDCHWRFIYVHYAPSSFSYVIFFWINLLRDRMFS